ncbi:hypothetical protein TNCV_986851 [Trichonephila clavipes]|nr:hypothetical protein TNCV_986851 [Trichonephila clavipes]
MKQTTTTRVHIRCRLNDSVKGLTHAASAEEERIATDRRARGYSSAYHDERQSQAIEGLMTTRVGPPCEGSEKTQPRTLVGQIK